MEFRGWDFSGPPPVWNICTLIPETGPALLAGLPLSRCWSIQRRLQSAHVVTSKLSAMVTHSEALHAHRQG